MSDENRRNHHGFATRAIHAGQPADPTTGAVVTPIYTAATFAQPSPGEPLIYDYSRAGNPTRRAYEDCVADLESGTRGFAFASGMAAISTVLELIDSGSHIVAGDDLYGGTARLFDRVRKRSANIETSYIDFAEPGALEAAIQPNTAMVWLESPTNPMLKMIDFEGLVAVARARGILTVVDNTFATPWLQRPIEHGVDIVVHSATKYLNGHSDVISGIAVVGNDPDLVERLEFLQKAVGAVAGPFDAYLAMRGVKTLDVRMARHCDNATTIAKWLRSHNKVAEVHFPGFEDRPEFALCERQMSGRGGGMVSARLDLDLSGTRQILERCQLFALAESLGGVESLIESPALMTHMQVPREEREARGIADGLIRLSVGIENIDDLIADLDQALS